MTTKRRGGKGCKPFHGSVCWRTVDACEVIVGDPPICVGCKKGRGYVIDERRVIKPTSEDMEESFRVLSKTLHKSISPEQHDPGKAIKEKLVSVPLNVSELIARKITLGDLIEFAIERDCTLDIKLEKRKE